MAVNNLDKVPLFTGGGDAFHSAENLRMLIWNIFRGQEGFLTSNAGKCRQLNTPGEGVQLLPGPFVINSRYPGGEMQAYMSRIIQSQIVETTAVPPGGGRRDLVGIRIRDPYPEGGGGQDPIPLTEEGKKFGPYVEPFFVEDVPPGTFTLEQLGPSRTERQWTTLASARLDRPGNTATIDNSMIKGVNIVCNPLLGVQIPAEVLENLENNISDIISDINGIRAQKVPVPSSVNDVKQCSSANGNTFNWNQYSPKRWPNEAGDFVTVPSWATWASVLMFIINPLQARNGANSKVQGLGTYRIGTSKSPTNIRIRKDDFGPAHDFNRPNIIVAAEFPINAVDRGKKVTHEFLIQSTSIDNNRGIMYADDLTQLAYTIQFKEKPDAAIV